jgi:hypothetical protein
MLTFVIQPNTFSIPLLDETHAMPLENCPEIREQYSFYNQLLKERKSIFEEVIEIKERGNRGGFLENETAVKHISLSDDITFIAAVNIKNYKSFRFKLRCKKLSGTPFFRFDSDGTAHRNYDESTPLGFQSISTPHFHHFSEKGECLAYKTDKLLNPAEAKALEDISLCVAHFCDESNLKLKESDYPDIQIVYGLGFKAYDSDPLENIQFGK